MIQFNFATVDTLPLSGQRAFWNSLEYQLSQDDGAFREHLEQGRPVYYCDDKYPSEIIREWPDGKRDLGIVTAAGQFELLRVL
ncbi:hypothetical protein GCM10027277_57510 [Pseudoduganella ginsengisoli]|uniref:Uncharacterized protein n=1 Tax=Pseudoduganella ginsengisoli TaxID=1462440 RepID=A0A6L6Q8E9_9BURK|nr:hypothetical protein [Pseudoduganella ginsengisoli]MTW05885.1 hypothetical protein [Pseudoduganella ginsengisoli]